MASNSRYIGEGRSCPSSSVSPAGLVVGPTDGTTGVAVRGALHPPTNTVKERNALIATPAPGLIILASHPLVRYGPANSVWTDASVISLSEPPRLAGPRPTRTSPGRTRR